MQNRLIHWSRIWDLMERTDSKNHAVPFQMKFVKSSNGEVREYKSCILTSIHSKGDTINVLPEGELRPRTILKVLIIEFNQNRVYI